MDMLNNREESGVQWVIINKYVADLTPKIRFPQPLTYTLSLSTASCMLLAHYLFSKTVMSEQFEYWHT